MFFVFDKNVHTMDALQERADKLTYANGAPAEGMVLRPTRPEFSASLGRPLSVKFINRNYKD